MGWFGGNPSKKGSGKGRGKNNPTRVDTFERVMHADESRPTSSNATTGRERPGKGATETSSGGKGTAHSGGAHLNKDDSDDDNHDNENKDADDNVGGVSTSKTRRKGRGHVDTSKGVYASPPRQRSGYIGEVGRLTQHNGNAGAAGRDTGLWRGGASAWAAASAGGALSHSSAGVLPVSYTNAGAAWRERRGGARKGRGRSGKDGRREHMEEGGVRDSGGVVLFWRPPCCLVQWTPSPFEVDGVSYANAEQWMMASKAMLFEDREMLRRIMNTEDPKEQKALGRKVRGFDARVWEEHGYHAVVAGNMAKFRQNPHFLEELLSTDSKILAEASPYDQEWGIGLDAYHPDALIQSRWPGKNKLGEALMAVRSELRNELFEACDDADGGSNGGFGGFGGFDDVGDVGDVGGVVTSEDWQLSLDYDEDRTIRQERDLLRKSGTKRDDMEL